MSRIASLKSRWVSSYHFRIGVYFCLITALISISLHKTFSIYFDGHDYQFLKENLASNTLSEFGFFGSITSKLFMDLIWSLEFRWFGNDIFGYRLVVFFLFFACSILVFYLALALFKKESIALLSSIFFTVHPVHDEVISWLSAQNYLFCLLFILVSIYLKIISAEKGKISILFFSFLFFILAILSKDFGIILPLLWLAYDLIIKRK
ncbi:glycosyltransferase family 39 protein, partial [bacterium]|nr:glycosyltransferase family 39 protein [bacterium]